jgi:hypothetical protein
VLPSVRGTPHHLDNRMSILIGTANFWPHPLAPLFANPGVAQLLDSSRAPVGVSSSLTFRSLFNDAFMAISLASVGSAASALI